LSKIINSDIARVMRKNLHEGTGANDDAVVTTAAEMSARLFIVCPSKSRGDQLLLDGMAQTLTTFSFNTYDF